MIFKIDVFVASVALVLMVEACVVVVEQSGHGIDVVVMPCAVALVGGFNAPIAAVVVGEHLAECCQVAVLRVMVDELDEELIQRMALHIHGQTAQTAVHLRHEQTDATLKYVLDVHVLRPVAEERLRHVYCPAPLLLAVAVEEEVSTTFARFGVGVNVAPEVLVEHGSVFAHQFDFGDAGGCVVVSVEHFDAEVAQRLAAEQLEARLILQVHDELIVECPLAEQAQVGRIIGEEMEHAADLTVPLAKYVALHCNELAFPFRRYQIGKVYRGERAQRGRFREFYQADIDIIGDGKLDILNEAEIPAIIYKVFRGFGLNRFQIRVNNRKILNGFYAMLGLTEKSGDIMRTVDKLDKIGAEKVRAELTDSFGIAADVAEKVTDFIALKGSNADIIAALREMAGDNELFALGIDELETVCRAMTAFGVPETNFRIDLSIARGLDYYTKTAFSWVTTTSSICIKC